MYPTKQAIHISLSFDNKIAAFSLAVFFCILSSCTEHTGSVSLQTSDLPAHEKIIGRDLPASAVSPMLLNVCFNEQTASELEGITGDDGYVQLPAVKSFDGRGIVRMRRLFPQAGRFEARTRAEGLHRWYEVCYDSSVPITKAAQGWVAIPGVEYIEFRPLIHIGGEAVPVEKGLLTAQASPLTAYPFDDPLLPSQWNYINKGTANSSAGGCDINILPAWNIGITGSPEVIVGVVDGGIDFNHEDLAANMWHNPEQEGDRRYGYNFATDSYDINPENHGTHVAGIIAAVNNNGLGVCGVAGGDAAQGRPGVKVMSCQIFDGKNSGSGAEAIKWSADHGAVISQNSWGFEHESETPRSLAAAVDYFKKYAGIDENGVQTGPMRGGIVVFAAGNDDSSQSGNSYAPIFNVAAVGADYRKAYYSNYGSWVDITAPGGDATKGNHILSTLVGNRYGIYQGTSMSCPQASGIAALIISEYGGEGLTPDQVEKKMIESATPITSFNRSYDMGAGLINAYKAVTGGGGGGLAPDKPSDLAVSVRSNNLSVSVKVPQDEDDGVPAAIVIYYKQFNFSQISDDLMFAKLYLDGCKAGDTIEATITGLDFNTVFYVAAAAEDFAGNKSALTPVRTVTTGFNTPPVIEASAGTELTVKPWQTASLDFRISDADGHFFLIDFINDTPGISLDTLVRSQPKIVVDGPATAPGTYTATLKATDIYHATASCQMSITVLENHSPAVIETIPDMSLNSTGETTAFDLRKYISDEDGEQLSYSVSTSDLSVADVSISGSTLSVATRHFGITTVTVTATDACQESCSFSFRILIRDKSRPVDLFPNPVSDKLNIRPGQDGRYSISICNKAGAVLWSDTVDAGPFDPVTVDVSSWSGGTYYVRIDGPHVNEIYTIVKK